MVMVRMDEPPFPQVNTGITVTVAVPAVPGKVSPTVVVVLLPVAPDTIQMYDVAPETGAMV